MQTPQIKTLFHLSNNDLDIIEIKRLDLPKDNPKDQLFYWLLIRQGATPIRLNFAGMTDGNLNQVRNFKEGDLSFNDKAGHYAETASGKTFSLDVIAPPILSKQLLQAIEDYLSNDQTKNKPHLK